MATGDTALGVSSQDHGLRVLPEIGRARSWPLQSFLGLVATPDQVSAARRHARHVLRAWGLTVASDDTEVVVSELVSNAVAISSSNNQEDILLGLISDSREVLVFTWDASPGTPQIANPAADVEDGRGLLLVEALSTQWGWGFPPGMGEKVVWAVVALGKPKG